MELRQIKYFVKVAEVLNFCEAARQLNISQSTVSQQIQQLENELGASLLTRDSHHVSLTDVGKAFLPQAVRTLKAAASCLDRIRDIQMLDSGELNIGSTYSFLPLLKETVLMFMKQYPGVKINIMCHSMETLLKMLNEERIDVALSYKPNFVQPGIDSHIMFDNKLAIIVSDTHPLARLEKVRLVDIEKFPFAMPAKGLQARNTFDLLTKDKDYRFDIRLEINEVNLLLDLVRSSSQLVSVISQAAVVRTPGLKVLSLDQRGTQMEGSFHTCSNAYMKRATKEFLNMLCENKAYNMSMLEFL